MAETNKNVVVEDYSAAKVKKSELPKEKRSKKKEITKQKEDGTAKKKAGIMQLMRFRIEMCFFIL